MYLANIFRANIPKNLQFFKTSLSLFLWFPRAILELGSIQIVSLSVCLCVHE